MLHHKHLKPWLLIYLVIGVLFFLSTVGIVVIIIINEINGFNFTPVQFSTCSTYTNYKMSSHMQTILQVCFIMSCFAVIVSLGQSVIVAWQFFIFRKSAQDNQNENQVFEELSLKKLTLLYCLTNLGFLSLIPIFGSFSTFYLELNNCSGSQNQSEKYMIPAIVAVSALLLQIFSLCILLKLLYHFYEDQKNEDQSETTLKAKVKQQVLSPSARKEMEKKQLQAIKKRIIDMSTKTDQFKNENGKNLYDTHTTYGSPNNTHNRLLDKNLDSSDVDNIYRLKDGFNQNPTPNKRNKHEKFALTDNPILNKTPKINDMTNNNGYSNQNFSNEDNLNNIDFLSNPDDIDINHQQKKIMKRLPKNGYKKNKINRNSPKDVIFEDPNEDWENSFNDQSNRKSRKIQRYISEEEENKAQIQINKLKALIDNQQAKKSNVYIFKTKYNLIMHQIKKKRGFVNASQRRCIKRHLMKVHSNIVNFDANKLDVQQFVIHCETKEENTLQKVKDLNHEALVQSEPKLQNGNQSTNIVEKQPEVTGQVSLQISPQKINRVKASRSAADIWQQGFSQGKKTQSYNPIDGYVQEGDKYESTIRKIHEFDRICARQNTQKSDPFSSYYLKGTQLKEKLYLHKNKPKMARIQMDNDDMQQYADRTDPFKDVAFEDDWFMNRGLLTREDSNQNAAKSDKKGLVEGIVNTAQPKRVNRKEGGLVELIRGKHPISFL